MLTGECQCLLGEGVRLLQAASQHLRLSQGEVTERLLVYSFDRHRLFQRLRQQRHSIGDTPTQSVCRTQGPSVDTEIAQEARVLTDVQGPFEQGEGPG